MSIEELQDICGQFPGVTEDIKWENHLCFCIAEKMFLIVGLDSVPTTASFKVPDNMFDEITTKPGFSPAAYLARYKWVHIDDIQRMSKEVWTKHISTSYHLIAGKLSKKKKLEFGLIE